MWRMCFWPTILWTAGRWRPSLNRQNDISDGTGSASTRKASRLGLQGALESPCHGPKHGDEPRHPDRRRHTASPETSGSGFDRLSQRRPKEADSASASAAWLWKLPMPPRMAVSAADVLWEWGLPSCPRGPQRRKPFVSAVTSFGAYSTSPTFACKRSPLQSDPGGF